MSKVLQFGEQLPQYAVPVLNEREARAGAGILFLVAIVAFMNAWFYGDFAPTKLVVIAFFIDFLIRVFVNPKYAPSLVLGRIAVRRQQPEYVGAPQKRFAWLIGFVLAACMMYLVVFHNVRGPVNLLICALCLLLLFFESAFGICIGCAIYNLFNKDKAQLCPGNVCEPGAKSAIQMVGFAQIVVVAVFAGGIFALADVVAGKPNATLPGVSAPAAVQSKVARAAEEERCKVPDFAIALGHADKWKLHNNCK
ncbi:MAG: DUF4395 domain-containing protein [Betaproteobacteria bacterium]|nr:DUF4395 domain-containing protein [Betaproteobacteria bacterium]